MWVKNCKAWIQSLWSLLLRLYFESFCTKLWGILYGETFLFDNSIWIMYIPVKCTAMWIQGSSNSRCPQGILSYFLSELFCVSLLVFIIMFSCSFWYAYDMEVIIPNVELPAAVFSPIIWQIFSLSDWPESVTGCNFQLNTSRLMYLPFIRSLYQSRYLYVTRSEVRGPY